MPEIFGYDQVGYRDLSDRKRTFVTTSWDDFADDQAGLLDLLENYGLRGTFYVVSQWVENPNSEIDNVGVGILREIESKGHEVASHSQNHRRLCDLQETEAKTEIEKSKVDLEKIMGHRILGIAYPYGMYDSKTVTLAGSAGYLYARTTQEGRLDMCNQNPHELGVTIILPRAKQARRFWLYGSRGQYLFLQLRENFRWERIARKLFVKALNSQGYWHLVGHFRDILEDKTLRSSLESLLSFIADLGEGQMRPVTNAELFTPHNTRFQSTMETKTMQN